MSKVLKIVSNNTSAVVQNMIQRGTGRGTDGTTKFYMVPDANNPASVGGDQTGVGKLYFYRSINGGFSYSLVATVNTGATGGGSGTIASMVVDLANHIHVVYGNQDRSARGLSYVKLTLTGTVTTGTYAVGTPVVIFAGDVTHRVINCDLDLMGNTAGSQVVITACAYITTSGANEFWTQQVNLVRSGTTLVTVDTLTCQLITSGTFAWQDGQSFPCSVAGLHEAFEDAGVNGTYIATLMTTAFVSGGWQNTVSYKVKKINVTTGVQVAVLNQASFASVNFYVNGGFTNTFPLIQFYTTHTRQFTVVFVQTQPGLPVTVYRLDLPSSGIATLTESKMSVPWPNMPTTSSGLAAFNGVSVKIDDDTIGWFCSDQGSNNGGSVWCWAMRLYGSVGSWTLASLVDSSGRMNAADATDNTYTHTRPVAVGYHSHVVLFAEWVSLYGGNNNNTGAGYWDLGIMYYNNVSANAYNYSALQNEQLNVTGLVTPAASSTVTTDTPSLAATVSQFAQTVDLISTTAYAQTPRKLWWRFSPNSSFTSGIIDYIEPDSDLKNYGWYFDGGNQDTPSINSGTQAASDTLPLINRLPQSLMYYKVAEIDAWGVVGAFSTAKGFTVAHAPAAANMSPSGGQVLTFGSGAITFSWYFTDPWVTDNQTAYQIQIIDVSTATTIVDTGKITAAGLSGAFTTLMSATASISSAYKGHQLKWQIKLWDSDNVAGAYSTPQIFYVADPPVPVITSPTTGSTITTPVPTVLWTPGTSGTTTQGAYRMVVSQGTSLVYDSGVVNTALSSAAIPFGYLQNNNSYTITLYIYDSIGLSGSTQTIVTVTFTPPAAPTSIDVWTYDFDTNGFVYIGWDNTTKDADFIYWNVYRRAQGDTAYTLLGSINSDKLTYGVVDYQARAGYNYTYAVTQVVSRFGGALIESALTAFKNVTPSGSYYWLSDSDGVIPAIPLYIAKADSFKDVYERNTYVVVGRGRHSDIGEHQGVDGQLTCSLRDKLLTNAPAQNQLADPGFQNQIPYSPQWAITASGTVSVNTLTYREPLPGNYPKALRIDASTGNVHLRQVLPVVPFAAVGDKFQVSIYLTDLVPANTYTVTASIVYKNAAGTTLATDPITLTNVENWNGNSKTFRWSAQETVPAGASTTTTSVQIDYIITDASGNGLSFLATGASVFKGSTLLPYGDGAQMGWQWDNVPYLGTSSTTGFYTARQQRLDIKEMCSLNRPLYLRSPFGDIYEVSLGDVQFDVLAGTGPTSQFGEIQIPYLEVAL